MRVLGVTEFLSIPKILCVYGEKSEEWINRNRPTVYFQYLPTFVSEVVFFQSLNSKRTQNNTIKIRNLLENKHRSDVC